MLIYYSLLIVIVSGNFYTIVEFILLLMDLEVLMDSDIENEVS